MFESALVATRIQSGLPGQERLSENALGMLGLHKSFAKEQSFPLWCIPDFLHGQEGRCGTLLAMLDSPSMSTCSLLELFGSTETLQQ